jgi:hypothetical protein
MNCKRLDEDSQNTEYAEKYLIGTAMTKEIENERSHVLSKLFFIK